MRNVPRFEHKNRSKVYTISDCWTTTTMDFDPKKQQSFQYRGKISEFDKFACIYNCLSRLLECTELLDEAPTPTQVLADTWLPDQHHTTPDMSTTTITATVTATTTRFAYMAGYRSNSLQLAVAPNPTTPVSATSAPIPNHILLSKYLSITTTSALSGWESLLG